jgi:hypothetical protein
VNNWSLRTPAKLPEETANMIGMITDTKLLLDELSDAATGPDLTMKAKGLSPFEQQGYQLRVLVNTEQGFGARRWMVTQHLDAMQGGPLQPLADGALGDAQGFGDVLLGPPLLI